MKRHLYFGPLTASLLIPAAISLAQAPSPAGYEVVLRTLADLWDYEVHGRPPDRRVSFEFPEWLVNGYLSASLKLRPRPGVKDASVELLPGNRVVATARIDFERVLGKNPAFVPDKLRRDLLKSGRLKAEFQFALKGSGLTYAVRPLPLDGVEIPPRVMQELVRRIGAMQPEKFDTTRPIPVPFGLRSLYSGPMLLGGGT